jgi:hypothetical protein
MRDEAAGWDGYPFDLDHLVQGLEENLVFFFKNWLNQFGLAH